jgi:hypothetical protein
VALQLAVVLKNNHGVGRMVCPRTRGVDQAIRRLRPAAYVENIPSTLRARTAREPRQSSMADWVLYVRLCLWGQT